MDLIVKKLIASNKKRECEPQKKDTQEAPPGKPLLCVFEVAGERKEAAVRTEKVAAKGVGCPAIENRPWTGS